ncbi:MAG: glycine/sarcosine/betaine reductase selenoprotein B family protein [Actinomycetota bacterium]
MSGDDTMRGYAATLPAPEFPDPAFVTPKPLAEATVAIVTSAALHLPGDDGFHQSETDYRVLPRESRGYVLGHWSPNFDRAGFTADLNVVFPIDRLEEMAAEGTIGAVSDVHMSFAGNQEDDGLATIMHDSGPRAAKQLLDAGVDVVLLTPV